VGLATGPPGMKRHVREQHGTTQEPTATVAGSWSIQSVLSIYVNNRVCFQRRLCAISW
jgi:hypothetical protein